VLISLAKYNCILGLEIRSDCISAMEYIKGQTLRQWMDENKEPDIKIVVSFVKQIIQGLRAFHRQEMLHCDLKPENIMIDEIGQIKLIDFGSTRIAPIAHT
jgi:protein phosphatase